MHYEYIPQGVCSKRISLEVEGDTLRSVHFEGGCHGNLQGISALVRGMKTDELLRRLEGIDCRGRGTSCPDQLCKAIRSLRHKASQASPPAPLQGERGVE